MTRLIDPGLGEISDRLTILALKILFATERGAAVDHWAREQTALLSKVRARTLNGPWFEAVLELAAVNAALWHAEDDLRAIRTLGLQTIATGEVGALAFRIQAFNDRRAALVEQINKDAGESGGAEKLREDR